VAGNIINKVIVSSQVLVRLGLMTGFLSVYAPAAVADTQCAVVTDAYVELHTGPGDVYPVTFVFERGDEICVIKSRTDWFKIQGGRGKQGWVYRERLLEAVKPN
jgi:uncharacterized protein YraI